MTLKDNLRKSLQSASQEQEEAKDDSAELAKLMADAAYLRQSSALINEALQKGYDVLQMANGDIVTTGTKTVVHTFSWDKENHKLQRQKDKEKKSRVKKDELIEELLDE